MDAFLEVVADTAEEVAADQAEVANQARSMQEARNRGASWSELVDGQGGIRLLDRLRSTGRKLAAATGRLSLGLAEGLRSEGLSHRAIARRLGVTHQRVSALLNGAGSADRRG